MKFRCNDNDEIQGSFAALRMTTLLEVLRITTVLGVLGTTTVLEALGTAEELESLRMTTGCGMLIITRIMRSRRSGAGAV
jgi:hypothetical protein